MKLLLCFPTPRGDIQIANNYHQFYPHDRLYAKYMKEFKAYNKMREYFLEHTEYDYMVIIGDDILVPPEYIEKLVKGLEKHHFKILSGFMNVDQHEYNQPHGRINATLQMPEKNMYERNWNFLTRQDLFSLKKKRYFKTQFMGFNLMAIHREVIEKHGEFVTTGIWDERGKEGGFNIDLTFCVKTQELGYDRMVDTHIDMCHLRSSGTINVGKKAEEFVFIPYTKNSK